MVGAFAKGAAEAGRDVSVVNVFEKKIGDCAAREYRRAKGRGECIRKDGMQDIYPILIDSETLVLAPPIYYLLPQHERTVAPGSVKNLSQFVADARLAADRLIHGEIGYYL